MRLGIGYQRSFAQRYPGGGGTFTVRAEITSGESVAIEVEDDGGFLADPRLHLAHGHGLDIVGALTDEWGIREIGKRRVVWARLD